MNPGFPNWLPWKRIWPRPKPPGSLPLKIEAERLQRERADHEKRLLDLQTELVNAQSELKTQLIELETSQASAKELAERVSALEDLETQLIQAEKRLEEVRRDITLQMTERDGVSALVLTLFSQRAEHENLLPKLRADVQVLKTELQTLTQDKNSIMVAVTPLLSRQSPSSPSLPIYKNGSPRKETRWRLK
jgi:DNA repair exonuclease SbcCD ATPase subunit